MCGSAHLAQHGAAIVAALHGRQLVHEGLEGCGEALKRAEAAQALEVLQHGLDVLAA
jgi:hypothetical protein